MPPRIHAFLAAIGVLLASGIAYHLLAKDTAQLDDAAARVALAPKVIGDWHGQDEIGEDRSFEQAGAKGYWMRTYVNQKTRTSVLVILMCGRSGKMAVHTPEVCYGGAGYELRDQSSVCTINDENFWTAQFAKKGVTPTSLRLYWSWNARGKWEASPAPRWQFRGEPFLYKLYVSRDISAAPNVAPQADAAAVFLRSFLPELDGALFPSTRQTAPRSKPTLRRSAYAALSKG